MSVVGANQARFDRSDIAAALGPGAAADLPADWVATGISTDTRTIASGNLYVALRGDAFDGHAYTGAAFERGAVGAVVDSTHGPDDDSAPRLLVIDTLIALGDLARHHRRRFRGRVVAIGGAMGKTTTKELTVAAVAPSLSVHATVANNNNRIGVPLTLLQLAASHEVAILEVGTNQPGEIAELARIVEADIGLITNIEEEHLEFLGNLAGVAVEETALFRELARRGAVPLVLLDDEHLADFAALPHAVTFGTAPDAQVQGRIELQADATATLTIAGHTVALKTLGRGMARNVLAATAIAATLGIPTDAAFTALADWEPQLDPAGYARMALVERAGVRVLVDCYNASPAGTLEALDVLVHLPVKSAGRRIAVLGDMLELGAAAPSRHDAILDRALEHTAHDAQIDQILLTGPEFVRAASSRTDPRLSVYDHVDACATAVVDAIQPGDVVLLKASHGIRLERVLRAIEQS